MNLSALWNLLSDVKILDLRAVSRQPQKPEWSGQARGQVVLTAADQETLIFSESGEWNFAEQPKIKFFNVYRWRRAAEDLLELSHLRHGINSPVHLLDFRQAADDKWLSEKPHVCREDLYSAVLSVSSDAITVNWRIEGPAKQQLVECFYSA